jgi:hypothetical protein
MNAKATIWRTGSATIFAGMALIVGLCLSALTISARADTGYNCFPSCSETDARFVTLGTGAGLSSTYGSAVSFMFLVPSSRPSFDVGIFDGDNGGYWDMEGQCMVDYAVYALPRHTGDLPVADRHCVDMVDNGWYDFTIDTAGNVPASDGNYQYELVVTALNPTPMTCSGFKVRSDAALLVPQDQGISLVPYMFGFPEAYVVYPNLVNWPGLPVPVEPYLTPTTYDGSMDLVLQVREPQDDFAMWDGDMDYGSYDCQVNDTDDPDTPNNVLPPWAGPTAVYEGVAQSANLCRDESGNPVIGPAGQTTTTGAPADDSEFAAYRRSPSVFYDVIDANGFRYHNGNPSGNMEWEQFRITTDPGATRDDADYGPGFVGDDGVTRVTETVLPAGLWQLHIGGLDLGNTVSLYLPHPALGVHSQGRMTGGGSVFTAWGVRVTHGFELHCDAGQGPNTLEINWGGPGQGSASNAFHLENLDRGICADDPTFDEGTPVAGFDTYVGTGTGRFNAAGSKGPGIPGYRATWTFTDHGQPGTADTAMIVIEDAEGATVLTVSGHLDNGNQQAHAH